MPLLSDQSTAQRRGIDRGTMSTPLIILLGFLATLAAFWGLFSIYAALWMAGETDNEMEGMDEIPWHNL